jgi:hypothetical protein
MKVKVRATQYHTYQGKEYQIWDEYEIDEQHLDTVVNQGKAARIGQEGPQREPQPLQQQPQEGQPQQPQPGQESLPKRGDRR